MTEALVAGVQILQIKMSQELQDEAKSQKGKVDQGVQEACWQRTS